MMRYLPEHIPLNEMGSFDLWAWQFLWFIGVWLGVRWAGDNLPIEKWARKIAVPSVAIALFCFIVRRLVGHGFEFGSFAFVIDKWHLGPLRSLDFVALGALLVLSQSFWKPLAFRPLVLLGQSSLQVFCVHLLFCFAGLTLLGNATMLNGSKQIALLSTTFAAMWITAKIFSKSESKNERQRKALVSSSEEGPLSELRSVEPAA
jgi:hypothetical protein